MVKVEATESLSTDMLPYEDDELPLFYGACEPDDLVERFSHFVIAVTDLDRSEAWYRDVIGMDVLGRNLTAEKRPHSVLKMNTGQLFILVEHETVNKQRIASHGVHHGFVLTHNQYIRAVSRLRELGIPVISYREEFVARGQYSIDVEDPDGHHYQIETKDDVQAHEFIPPQGGVIDCGPASDYVVGDVKLFRDSYFYLVRVREGFMALSRWCTHMNGLLVYQREHWRFWCPMHTATFDRCGEPTVSTGRMPAVAPLRAHPVSFSPEGHVLVNTDAVYAREAFDPSEAAQPPSALEEEING